MKKLLAMAIAGLAGLAQAATFTVAPGESIDYDFSTAKTSGDVVDLGAGATLRLVDTSNKAGTVPTIMWRVAATNGAATIDASALNVDAIQFARGLRSTGTLTVTGTKKVIAGWEAATTGDTNFTLCSVEGITFTAADAQGLELSNAVTIGQLPTSYPLTIIPGTKIAATGKDALARFYTDGKLELTDWDLCMLSTDLVDKDVPIRVGANRTLSTYFIKPGIVWLWNGNEYSGDHNATNTIELLDSTATLRFSVPQGRLNFYGSISGSGNIEKNRSGRAEIFADCTASGNLVCGGAQFIKHNASTFGDEKNSLSMAGGIFGIKPVGYETEDTHVYVERIYGSSGAVYAGKLQTFEIGLLEGSPNLDAMDATSTYIINDVSADVTIKASKPNKFVLKKSDAEGTVKYVQSAATGTLELNGENICMAEINVAVGNTLLLSGTGTVSAVTGAGKLKLAAGASITVNEINPAVTLDSSLGKVSFAAAANWQSKVSLWLDPSDDASVIRLHEKGNSNIMTYTNNYELVHEVKDKRPEQTAIRFLNNRDGAYSGDVFPQCYPYLVTEGGPNGLAYLSFGSLNYTGPVAAGGANGTEARRLEIWKKTPPSGNKQYHSDESIDAKWIVMVFGSQTGGGMAIVGSPANPAVYKRADTTLNGAIGSAGNQFTLYKDGAEANSTTDKFSGGWELLSFQGPSTFRALGYATGASAQCGGQNYGEVIIFGEMPTAAERIACERYLARKWGVAANHYTADVIELQEGMSSVEVGVESGAKVKLNRDYRGTLNLSAGAELTLPTVRQMITEANVPSEGRLAWFDPNLEGAVRMGVYPGRPLAVFAVSGRNNDGLDETYYLNGTSPKVLNGTGADRRPWLDAASRGGAATNWLNFSHKYETNGNMLRFVDGPVPSEPNLATDSTAQPTRTAFVVLDSTNGGGTPIAKTYNSGSFPYRTPADSLELPIWSGVTDTKVTGGTTRLDGVVVDGTVSGYSGRPEVLSLETTGAVDIGYFGIYGSADSNPNTAILGEILLYDRVLSATDRADVEAYLMQKWLGKMQSGYGDFSAAVVNGAGTVKVSDFKAMPSFGEGFTGVVELIGDAVTFTVDPSKPPVVRNAVTLTGTVKFPDEVTFTFDCASKPRPGVYPLVTADAVIAPTAVNVQKTGTHGNAGMRVRFTATSAVLEVPATGTLLIVR